MRLASVSRQRLAVQDSTVCYINVRKAVSGSTQATITLNNDGTLSKVEAQTVDTTLEKILGALPVSEAVSAALGLPAPPATEAVEAKALMATFTITPVVYRYVVSRDYAPGLNEIPNGTTDGTSKQLLIVRSDAAKKPAAAAPDADAFTFQGRVQLPKEKEKEKDKPILE